MRVVLPERAESAIFQLRGVWGALDAGRGVAPGLGRSGRLPHTPSSLVDRLGASAALVQMLAITEGYFSDALHSYGAEAPVVPRFAERVVEITRVDADASWDSRAQAWQAWHGIKVIDFPGWQKLRTLTDLRNALLHGDGRLTRRQTRSSGGHRDLVNRLLGLGVGVVGDQVSVPPTVAKACLDTCESFIAWLGWTSLSSPTE